MIYSSKLIFIKKIYLEQDLHAYIWVLIAKTDLFILIVHFIIN